MTLVRDTRLPRASLLLEVLYVAECQAEPALETGRFLPAKLLRLLIDESGRDRAAELPHEALVGQGLGRGQKLVSRILEARGERLIMMIESGTCSDPAAAGCIAAHHHGLMTRHRYAGGGVNALRNRGLRRRQSRRCRYRY